MTARDDDMLDVMAADVDRRRFTADEYQRMGEAGILAENDRVELIDGEVLTMTPIDARHAAAVDRGAHALFHAARGLAIVRGQNPVRLDNFTEPQPDLVLLRPRDDFYASGHPGPTDILLLIEIADASLRYDRELKAPRYAHAGIIEYWLVDLDTRVVTCYASPGEGTFRQVTTHARGETLSPRQLPECVVRVDDFLAD